MDAGRPVADWRAPCLYTALARAGRHAFAWEWLRRSPAYRDAAFVHRDGAGSVAFGLCRFECPSRDARVAQPIWRMVVDPFVLRANLAGDDVGVAGEVPAPLRFADDEGEHWLWADGPRQLRLDIAGNVRGGKSDLEFIIAGGAALEAQALALQRFAALRRHRRLLPSLFPAERRAPRWALTLRVFDALAAGASHRDIAEHLLANAALPRWRTDANYWRDRVQRLATAARRTALCNPRRWLDGSVR